MKVAAAVLTYRPVHFDRFDLLDDTIKSLRGEADAVYLIDNSPDDESIDELRARYGRVTTNRGVLHTSGKGINLLAHVLEVCEPLAGILVHSDDDVLWRPDWRDRLEQWWQGAPDDLALTGCHIEPEFYWNEVTAVVEFGGIKGLCRHSTGAASWTYRPQHRSDIFPVPEQVQGVGDVPACQHLEAKGLGICQIDLADHMAQGDSTWGNRTLAKYGWDDAPVKAMLR
jgi:hypothetical protein